MRKKKSLLASAVSTAFSDADYQRLERANRKKWKAPQPKPKVKRAASATVTQQRLFSQNLFNELSRPYRVAIADWLHWGFRRPRSWLTKHGGITPSPQARIACDELKTHFRMLMNDYTEILNEVCEQLGVPIGQSGKGRK